MKKLFVLFSLVFCFSFFCNDINAQQCSSTKDVSVGEIKVGGTFQLSINQGESHVWASPTLQFVKQTSSYIEYRYKDRDYEGTGTTSIGQVTISSSSGYKCHNIYGRVTQ